MPNLYHTETVKKEWIDHYGHLNEASYLVAFSNATWNLQNYCGIGKEYFDQTGCALYTAESHILYHKEVRPPAKLYLETIVFGVQEKKIWIGHQIKVENKLRASFECIIIHVDTKICRAVALPKKPEVALKKNMVKKLPSWVGRSVSFYKKI